MARSLYTNVLRILDSNDCSCNDYSFQETKTIIFDKIKFIIPLITYKKDCLHTNDEITLFLLN